jgi:hypothetical protein
MDDERQLTLTLTQDEWQQAQSIANNYASKEGWLSGRGSEHDHLTIWVIGVLGKIPIDIDKNTWLKQALS